MVPELDRPVWAALHGRQAAWAEDNGLACRYLPEVTSRGALANATPEAFAALAALQQPGEATDVTFDQAEEPPAGWKTLAAARLLQYVHEGAAPAVAAGEVEELGAADSAEMLALARLTKPGPFGTRTHELGDYLGVRRQGKLVAMAGERIKLAGYTEISAVCTHPEATGQGLAAGLVARLVARIQGRGEGAFLHVLAHNARAIALYERLGFRLRRQMQVLLVRRPD
ncbi:MAG TPA: GNAT family N-acetyltransferase [Terriglobales bacterium]|nr:GNAT family N-acetyltransferase [Terriglobales bacterium]